MPDVPFGSVQHTDAETAAAIPRICPACSSDSIACKARHPSDRDYWRCLACGEIWTPARRMARLPWRL